MNHAIWIAKKNELCSLIKKVSDKYGGDDVEWLRQYAKDVVDAQKDSIDDAILCFNCLLNT